MTRATLIDYSLADARAAFSVTSIELDIEPILVFHESGL